MGFTFIGGLASPLSGAVALPTNHTDGNHGRRLALAAQLPGEAGRMPDAAPAAGVAAPVGV